MHHKLQTNENEKYQKFMQKWSKFIVFIFFGKHENLLSRIFFSLPKILNASNPHFLLRNNFFHSKTW